MTVTIQSTDLRRRVRAVLDRVQREQEAVIVRTYDEPQVVIIPYKEFAAFQAWQERKRKREVWMAELRTIAEQVSAGAALSEEEALALIEEADRHNADSSHPATS
jgi:prevent-host-death family protein